MCWHRRASPAWRGRGANAPWDGATSASILDGASSSCNSWTLNGGCPIPLRGHRSVFRVLQLACSLRDSRSGRLFNIAGWSGEWEWTRPMGRKWRTKTMASFKREQGVLDRRVGSPAAASSLGLNGALVDYSGVTCTRIFFGRHHAPVLLLEAVVLYWSNYWEI